MALAIISPTALAAHFSPFAGRFDCPGIGNSMECARFTERALHSPYVRRVAQGRLDILLMGGGTRSLVDGDPANVADGEFYSALELDPRHRFVVIHRQHYEGSVFGLLDRKTGTLTPLGGYPVLSPDRHWIAVADSDEESATLQIFSVNGGRLMKAFDANPQNWGIRGVAWDSNTVLSYRRVDSECLDEKQGMCPRVLVQFDGKRWR